MAPNPVATRAILKAFNAPVVVPILAAKILLLAAYKAAPVLLFLFKVSVTAITPFKIANEL